MKKILTMAMVLVAAVFSFTACSKKANDGKITRTVWESTNGPDEFIKKAGEIYTQSHPNITIKYVNVELGDAVGQIALDGPAGKGADILPLPMTDSVHW